ncbi:MAG TPA: GTPase HflX [Vicinamibacterales bacterium]
MTRTAGAATGERAALVGLVSRRVERRDAERSIEELAGLAAAAGATVALRMLQERDTPDPATFLGRGKIETLARACDAAAIDLVIFDNELSPAQLREIEGHVDRKILDRTQLILDIFARRARTREGKWQVELAQLKYLLPRLVGSGTALSRLGGGIGTRGPGETKLETDRRRVRDRIHALQREIDQIRRRRRSLRGRRQKTAVPTVALVGYTNAGKTTLFNLLTRERAEASDALFVTLDPLVRQVRLPDRRELLVSDTVGFIDRLPHTLVAAFRATLEEVAEADLILHVIDAADPERERHVDAVLRVLDEVGAADVPRLDVFNKCDKLEPIERARLQAADRTAACISALHGDGRDQLLEIVTSRLELDTRRVRFDFDNRDEGDRQRIARVYRHARVLSHVAVDHHVSIEADVPRRLLGRFERSHSTGAS